MANITRIDPFGEMVTLRQAMDRLFEDSWVNSGGWRSVTDGSANAAVDVHETADELVVTAALPGVKPEDVEITITGQKLSLRGEFKASEEVSREQYLYRERRYGTFHRSLQLPVRVDSARADATFRDGILTLRVPKAEEVKPRQIAVKATSEEATSEKPIAEADNGTKPANGTIAATEASAR